MADDYNGDTICSKCHKEIPYGEARVEMKEVMVRCIYCGADTPTLMPKKPSESEVEKWIREYITGLGVLVEDDGKALAHYICERLISPLHL